jgi:hypothetical protein
MKKVGAGEIIDAEDMGECVRNSLIKTRVKQISIMMS